MDKSLLKCNVINTLKQHFTELQEYQDREVACMVFKNNFSRYSIDGGWRLTDFGQCVMSEIYQNYVFDVSGQTVTNWHVIKLNKHTAWPYHLTNKRLVLYSSEDAMWMKMYNSDVCKFIQAMETEE